MTTESDTTDKSQDTPMYCTRCHKTVQDQGPGQCPKGGNHHLLSISDKGVQGQGDSEGTESPKNSKPDDPHKAPYDQDLGDRPDGKKVAMRPASRCKYCKYPIYQEGQSWVDSTGGDVCSGDDNLNNENESHVPSKRSAKKASVAQNYDRIRAYAMQYLAHDSGDGQTVYHCPFCGGGNVIGRSDGTIECGFCNTHFTVQVQPEFAGMPQTIDGQPYDIPGMPGGVDPNTGMPPQADDMETGDEAGAEGFPPDQEDPEGAEMGSPEDEEAQGKNGSSVPWEHQSRLYRTAAGALTEDQYMAHLALIHSVGE